MENILKIATGITNPFSLLALTYLVIFLLFRDVLTKVGIQEGTSGYLIIQDLMSYMAIIAVLTLIAVFFLKAYEVYKQPKLSETIEEGLSDVRGDIKSIKDVDLHVEYFIEEYTGANVLIGNQGNGIVLVSGITIHWTYKPCERFEEPMVGAPLVEFRYEVYLSKSNSSKLLTTKKFKYGPGDVDKFLVDLHFPDYGIYTIWLTFKYKNFGDEEFVVYSTPKRVRECCTKW